MNESKVNKAKKGEGNCTQHDKEGRLHQKQ